MAERLQGFFYSETGTVWLVKIYDSSYVGATTDFQCESIRFNWTPDEAENRFSPILSSECRLRIVVNNSTLETFMDDLEQAEEGRFVVAMTNVVGLGNTVAWNGYIMPDLIVREDVPLVIGYTVEIKAKDGLNWLKNIDYNDAGSPYGGPTEADRKPEFVDHILTCINKLTALTALYTNSQTILNIICNWHENSWTYGSTVNPLARSRINHKAFYHLDSRGNYVWMSCYDVLKEICKAWGARLVFSGTAYWFVQLNEYRAPTALTIFQITKTGSTSTATSQDISIFHDPASGSNELTRYSGGNFQFYPAYKLVQVDYEHINTRNLIPGQVWDQDNATSFLVEDIDDNTLTSAFVFNGLLTATTNYTGAASFYYHFLVFRFTINVGTSYLRRDVSFSGGAYSYGETKWESSLYYYYVIFPPQYLFRFKPEKIGPIQIAFETPANIQSGDLLFNFEYVEARFANTLTVVPSGDITVTYSLASPSLEFLYEGVLLDQNDINRHSASNTGTASAELKVKTQIGDGPGKTTPTHIEILDSSNNWVLSDSWQVAGAGTARAFSQLLVDAIISGQSSPVKRFGAASFRSSDPDGNPILPHVAISYDSSYWVFHRGQYDVGTEIMQGEWWKQQTGAAYSHNSVEYLPRGSDTDGPPSAGSRPGGGNIPDPIGGGSSKTPYHQRFSAHSSATLTITANGGLVPSNEAQIQVFQNGQMVSPDSWTVSGSVITLSFTPVSKNIDVYFWYP